MPSHRSTSTTSTCQPPPSGCGAHAARRRRRADDTRKEFRPGHYAFLVSDAEFDAAFARIRAQGVRYYADPRRTKPGEINYLHGGRGVYFDDPDGHLMEVITQPYGDPPEQI